MNRRAFDGAVEQDVRLLSRTTVPCPKLAKNREIQTDGSECGCGWVCVPLLWEGIQAVPSTAQEFFHPTTKKHYSIKNSSRLCRRRGDKTNGQHEPGPKN